MSDITSTEKKRRFIMFCLLGALAAGVIIIASFMLFAPAKTPSTTKLPATRTDAVTGQAGGAGSDEYNRKLETHDEQKANAALTAGDSYIPTPVGKREPAVTPKTSTPPPPPPVAQVRVAPAQAPRSDNNAMLKRMMDDLAALDTKLSSVTDVTTDILFFQKNSGEKRKSQDWVHTTEIEVDDLKEGGRKPAVINNFYAQRPDQIIGKMVFSGGMYQGALNCVADTSLDLGQEIEKRLELLPEVYVPRAENVESAAVPAFNEQFIASGYAS
jgi:hypothetical protein